MVYVENSGRGPLKLRFGVHLPVGVTEVDESAWDQCKHDPITRHYLEAAKRVRVVSGPIDAPTVNVVSPNQGPETNAPKKRQTESKSVESKEFADLHWRQAVAVVKSCEDHSMLRQLLAAESRSSVQKAIEARLEQLG